MSEEQIPNHGGEMEFVEVSSREQLLVVVGLRSLHPFISTRRLLLQIPSVQASLQHKTERRLNFWLGVCGCTVGGLMFLISLGWEISRPSEEHTSNLNGVLAAIGFVLASSVGGKLAAVIVARIAIFIEIALFLRRSIAGN